MAKKAQYKRFSDGKEQYCQSVFNERHWICMSRDRKRWLKRCMNRAPRRKQKQKNSRICTEALEDYFNEVCQCKMMGFLLLKSLKQLLELH